MQIEVDPAEVLGLKQDYAALVEFNGAVMAVSDRKDREYRAAQHSAGLLAMLVVVFAAAFVVAAGVAVWR